MDRAVDDLRILRLVSPAPDGGDGALIANPPFEALAPMLGSLEAQAERNSLYANRLRLVLDELGQLYDDSGAGAESTAAIERFADPASVQRALVEAMCGCKKEIVATRPGDGPADGSPGRGLPDELAVHERGVRVRLLYPHAIRYRRAALAHARRLAAGGAEIRTSDSPLPRTFLFDNETVFLPDTEDPHGAVAVYDPVVVAFVRGVLETAWTEAEPLREPPAGLTERHLVAERSKQAILRLLITGAKDEAIARQLGLSLRTCRRHIAELMDRLGAESRFQAGWLTSANGRLPPPDLPD
ncbi:helix-turn-helix transcriptional regulator [Streptomyces sp. NPDC006798]|uniref:helix-turn-helix transcriptional regulator n=1 Tax=Streptomyces sp. NPDC006798 TaxID=3155462 RepID=UPI0033D0EFE2